VIRLQCGDSCAIVDCFCAYTQFSGHSYWAHRAVILAIAWHLVVFVKAGISRMPVKWQNDITCQVRLVTGSKLQLTCWSLSMTKLH